MQCKEFRGFSEAYLSDELLTETNIQIFRHLENCPECRAEFAANRNLRMKMRTAVENSPEFSIDPVFDNRLTESLRAEALGRKTRRFGISARFFVPAFATLLVVFTIGAIFLTRTGGNEVASNATATPADLASGLTKISIDAVGNHHHCALDQLEIWNEMSKKDYPKKAAFTEKVATPLQSQLGENVEMLHAHDCIYKDKIFTHVILRKGERIISVFIDKTDELPGEIESTTARIVTESENGLQVASFEMSRRAVFVISDLSEGENLTAARTLAGAFSKNFPV